LVIHLFQLLFFQTNQNNVSIHSFPARLAFVEPTSPKASKSNLKSLWAFILKTPIQYQ